jgi:D-glycero-beta-D-manno-heptose-7-phosphate kinase
MTLQIVQDIVKDFQRKKIIVVGDVMLDHYLWGKVERVSPEAPVPVVDMYNEEYRLGGAANVVYNLKALGAEPFLIGLTGDDGNRQRIKQILDDCAINSSYLLADEGRPTTIKSRIIAQNQQMVRIDYESKKDIDKHKEDQVIRLFVDLAENADGVIFEDYNKGILTKRVISKLIEKAQQKKLIITVDPKFKNFFNYTGCTIFKPNLSELQKNTGKPIETDTDLNSAAEILLKKLKPKYLVITRGEKGLAVFDDSSHRTDIPTFAQQVFDVSGAGDTAISVLTLALCSGAEINSAAVIANHAAGAVCGKIGIQPVYPEEIFSSFQKYTDKRG